MLTSNRQCATLRLHDAPRPIHVITTNVADPSLSPSRCPAVLPASCRNQQRTTAFFVHMVVFRRLWVIRLVFVSALLAHVLEAWYAFSRAKGAGHGDTAPLWLIQTLVLGFPSTLLVIQLLS